MQADLKSMNVRVQFFSRLRDLAGLSEMELEVQKATNVTELLDILYSRTPALRSVAKILERSGNAEIAAAHKLNHSLQVVPLLSCDPDLPFLELALDFEVLRFDGVNDFLRLVAFEPLLNFQFLSGVAKRRDGGLDLLDVAQVHSPLAQFPNDDLAQTSQPGRIFGRESDLVFLRQDFRDAPLEIKPRRQFLARLIERIINFLRVHF